MTNDELKAAWAVDINSEEKYNEVFNRTRSYLTRSYQGYPGLLPQADRAHLSTLSHGNETWPLQRDMIREAIGYYREATSVLKWLRTAISNTGAGQQFPHICVQNPGYVAYMHDSVQAKADRKRSMPIGRYLRQVLLFVPDSEIQRLEQMHRSELDTSFKLAETVEAIHNVYLHMDGDNACMRYGMSNFNHVDYHPSAVYASPGMGVAYTEVDGVIKSRSVVWVNPDDADDKRYVRVYGDPVLKKKLEANGYRMRGLAGAKLTIYRDSSFTSDATVVMPWIDPAGGIHASNVDRSYDSAHAVRFKGENFITLVTPDQAAKYREADIWLTDVQSQTGHADVPEVDPSQFHYTCAVSGLQTNRMDTPTLIWIDGEGTVRQARASVVNELDNVEILRIFREGKLRRGYCTKETKDAWHIPGFTSHFNDEATRESAGLCMLDSAFYPDSERYAPRADCVFMENAEGVRQYIRKSDTLRLYAIDDDKYVHVEMVRALKKDGCLPVAVFNGYRGLAHKSHPLLVVTRGGKRVIRGKHEVSKMWDGTWEYSRNVVTLAACGMSLQVGKTEDQYAIEVPATLVHERFAALYQIADTPLREKRLREAFMRGFRGGQTYMKKDGNVVACDYYNKPADVQAVVDAAKEILVNKDDAEWTNRVLSYSARNAIPWARIVVAAWDGWKAHEREREMALAEANAVEAAPTTAAVIEKLNTLADSDMDRLIAEVDDTLATAVVRRWPRLNQMPSPDGMGPQASEEGTVPALDGRGRLLPAEGWTPVSLSAENEAHHAQGVDPMPVQGVDPMPVQGVDFVIVPNSMSEAEDARIRQAQADDALLAQLAAAGLTTTVVPQ